MTTAGEVLVLIGAVISAFVSLINQQEKGLEDKGTIDVSLIEKAVKVLAGLVPGEGGEEDLAKGVAGLLRFFDRRGITPDDIFDVDG